MINEVKERIELVVQCSGSRRISKENLTFMFDKYELSPEDRQAILAYCEERKIAVYEETPYAAEVTDSEDTSDHCSVSETSQPKKKGLLARLFGF